MPVLKHAKKKQRQDRRRTLDNKQVRDTYKKLLKLAKAKPTPESVSKAFQSIDKAAKKNIIHKNKAARLKSTLSKVTSGGQMHTKTATKSTVKAEPKTPEAKPEEKTKMAKSAKSTKSSAKSTKTKAAKKS